MFDLSGGGKSQGDYVTYGIKEQEDISKILFMQHRLSTILPRKNISKSLFCGVEVWEQWQLCFMRSNIIKIIAISPIKELCQWDNP